MNKIIINLKATLLPDKTLREKYNELFVDSSSDIESKIIPIFDSFAVVELNKIILKLNAQLVITDDWLWTSDFNRLANWFVKNNLQIKYKLETINSKNHINRLKAIQYYLSHNNDVALIIDDHYSTKNIFELAVIEEAEYYNYILNYGDILGQERRKSLIPNNLYVKYENFKPSYGDESKKIVHINDLVGFTEDSKNKCWEILKKFKYV